MAEGLKLEGATVLVTGANRGIGRALVRAALRHGARKVWAGMRRPEDLGLPGVEAVELDVTDAAQVRAAAARCSDVDLLVNNAGIAEQGGVLPTGSEEALRRHLEVNLFGIQRMAQAFAPVLAARGGGALLNVLSTASWLNWPVLGAYGVSKSAAWALTNGLRVELADQGTLVCGLHVGFVDTDLVRDIEAKKLSPDEVADCALDGVAKGVEEILVGERAYQVKRGLTAEPPAYVALAHR